MNRPIDIIIPTWNNPEYLRPCIQSIMDAKTSENLFRIIVVNNGHANSCDYLKGYSDITVIDAGDNLGWEGGLKLGLEHSTTPFVMFLNDDTHIPFASRYWLNIMLQHFLQDNVAAVGSSTNVVMGTQNIFAPTTFPTFESKFLIFYCVLLRRAYVDAVGGVDDTLPGGDDFDMSIRLRKAGYTLVTDRNVFVYHHGFKTGTRLYGDHTASNGWNSYGFKEKVDHALIKKHGFKTWWEAISSAGQMPQPESFGDSDAEGDIIRKYIKNEEVILDIGCGGNKTVPQAVGMDLYRTDAVIDSLGFNKISQSDVIHDANDPLPYEEGTVDIIVARHILEHLIDPVSVLKSWHKTLKNKGKLLLAVPNNGVLKSIPLNTEHLHAFNMDSMRTLLEVCGYNIVEQIDPKNGISFVTIAEKHD